MDRAHTHFTMPSPNPIISAAQQFGKIGLTALKFFNSPTPSHIVKTKVSPNTHWRQNLVMNRLDLIRHRWPKPSDDSGNALSGHASNRTTSQTYINT